MSNDIDRLKARALAGDLTALETLTQRAEASDDDELKCWCVRRYIDRDEPVELQFDIHTMYFGPLSVGNVVFIHGGPGSDIFYINGPLSLEIYPPLDGHRVGDDWAPVVALESRLIELQAERYLDFYPDDAFAQALRTGHWPADEPIEPLIEHRLSMARDFLAGRVPFQPLMCRDVPRLELMPWGRGLLFQTIGPREVIKWLLGGREPECDLTLRDIDPGWPTVGPVTLSLPRQPLGGTASSEWTKRQWADDPDALRALASTAQRHGDEATLRWCVAHLIALGEPCRVRVGDEVVAWAGHVDDSAEVWQRTAWCLDPEVPRWLEAPVRMPLVWDARRRAALELEMLRTLLPLHGVQRPEGTRDWIERRLRFPLDDQTSHWSHPYHMSSSLITAVHQLRRGFDASQYRIAALYGEVYGHEAVQQLVAIEHLCGDAWRTERARA